MSFGPGCELRLREAISLERELVLNDKVVLQALDKVREKLYLAVNRGGQEAGDPWRT